MRFNNLKKFTLFVIILSCVAFIFWQKLMAQNYPPPMAQNYPAYLSQAYNNAIISYNNNNYVGAHYLFSFVSGSIQMMYFNRPMPKNVQSKLGEIGRASNYCANQLTNAVNIERRMERYGNNFTVSYTVYSGGKMDAPSASRRVQENVTLTQSYTPKPPISGRLY